MEQMDSSVLEAPTPMLPPAPAPSFVEPETQADDLPLTVIERKPGWHFLDLEELWRYRELLYILVWRDVKVRYKQTILGATWAILQPLATMVVFTLFLSRVAGNIDVAIPYPLFVFSGLLPWMFFNNAVSAASNSVVGNERLVTKVYFPRLLVPLSAVVGTAVDFAIGFVMLLILMPFFGLLPGWWMLAVPISVLLIFLLASGLGVLLSALTVAYRDFRYVVPFTLQLWMFATPAIFLQDLEVLGPRLCQWLLVNPMHGLVVNFRACVFGGPFDLASLAVSVVTGLVWFVAGSLYFRRIERTFADVI